MSKGNGLKRLGKWRFWQWPASSTVNPRSPLTFQGLEDRHVLDAVISALGSSIPGTFAAVTGEPPPFTGGVLVAAGDVTGDGYTDIVTGAGPGGGPHVRVFDGKSGQIAWEFMAYDPAFRGGCAVALGDVTGDGRLDVITGAGPGGGPHVKVFDGTSGAEVRSFFAFDPGFLGGVSVAAGDIDGDGFTEIVTGAGPGGGPHVKVFDGRTGELRQSLFAYADDFRGGVNVSVGDVTGDGTLDLVTGAGPGGGPHVKVFDGKTRLETASLFAYAPEFRGGVYVAAADVTGDGVADLLTGAGAGGGPHVRLIDGKTGTDRGSWMAYSPAFGGGASVALADLDADGRADVVTGAGPGGGPHVRAFSGTNAVELASFFAYNPLSVHGQFISLTAPPAPEVPPPPLPPTGPNTPPTITDLADQTTAGPAVGPLAFTIGDADTPAERLLVSVTSTRPDLALITISGSGTARSITLTPQPGRYGTAVVTLRVTDGDGATASEEFALVVNPPVVPPPPPPPSNTPPTLTDLADQTSDGPTVGPLTFTISDRETPVEQLIVTASSTAPELAAVSVSGVGQFRSITLTPQPGQFGTAVITLRVSDGDGAAATKAFSLVVNRPAVPPPPPPSNTPPTITGVDDQTTDGPAVGPLAISVGDAETPAAELTVTAIADVANLATISLGGTGSTRSITLTPTGTRTGSSRVTVTVRDAGGATASRQFGFSVTAPAEPQPELVSFTDFGDATSFLYTGPDAVQTGMPDGTIRPLQAAVVRGKVQAVDGSPLQGVVVSILNHGEYGQATSRADGSFDLVVNGGGPLTVVYAKPGFLQVQRTETVPWRDFALLPVVALTPLDERVTAIDLLDTTTPIQAAQGSVETDADGSRRATLLFAQGTQATMTLPDGTTQPLNRLAVRATEYTVGESGKMAMPGTLPPESGYTYAVELSVDQAIAAGASRVDFSQPVPVYVTNFLNFPVGMTVPAGYYDREAGQWIASDNGKVVKILSETATDVVLDTDGDGVGDNSSQLVQLGITAGERSKLAELFDPGQSFWRTPVTHFTPWDLNWPFGPPEGARGPDGDPNDATQPKEDEQNLACGSVIGIENQTLGERVGIAGTPFSLVYQSDRVSGRSAERTFTIPLSKATLPPNLKRIDLEIDAAGRRFIQSFAPTTDLQTQFQWDGMDAYGRLVGSNASITVTVRYAYQGVYHNPATFDKVFAQYGSGALSANISRGEGNGEAYLSQTMRFQVDQFNALSQNLGGMTLDIQHAYDADSGTLFFGDGTQVSQKGIGYTSATVAAGNGDAIYSGDGGPATGAGLVDPTGVAVAYDGTIYLADRDGHRIRRIGTDGVITTVAGTGVAGFSGDGGPATSAQFDQPTGIAIAPDGTIFVADQFNNRIRRFTVGGTITTVAGNGTQGFSGDGGRPTDASINQPTYVAVRPDGTVFFTDWGNHRVRSFGHQLRPNGSVSYTIRTVAGNGQGDFSGDGGPATNAALNQPSGIAFDRSGNIYIADTANQRIRLIGVNGFIYTYAGIGTAGFGGDGGLAQTAQLNRPVEIAFSREGELLIAEGENRRVRRVTSSGVISTIAGGGGTNYLAEGGIATRTSLGFLSGVAVSPDGSILVTDLENSRLVRIQTVLPNYTPANQLVPSRSGNELYEFSSAGRHLRTYSTLTNTILYQFGYDARGRLTSVRDTFGNETRIERSTSGSPVSIVSPFGQRTRLTTNTNGYITEVANPANESYLLHYGTGGLLTRFTDPRGNTSRMTYDSVGRLTRDEDPVDGFTDLIRTKLPGGGRKITTVNAVSGTRHFLVETSTDGSRTRTAIDGRGFSTVTDTATDGSKRTVSPDGTVTTPIYAGDPRFGLSSPVVSQFLTATPGGLTSVVSTNRTAAFSTSGVLTRLTSETVVNGRSFLSDYDAVTRTVVNTSAAGRRTTTTLDEFGRPTVVSVPGIEPTRYLYDSRGRIRSISQGTRFVSNDYDASGRLSRVRDSLNNQTSFEYDAADRVTKQTSPDGTFTLFRYDAGGNLVGLTPPGQPEHVFAYNNRNQVLGETPPPVGPSDDSTRYVYNAARQLVQQALPGGQIIEYAYCDCGRLTGATTPWGQYDYVYSSSTGDLNSVASPGGFTVSFGYDGGLVTSETTTGPVAGRLERTFDNNFRVTSEQVNGGSAVTFGYDADGLLTRAGELTLARTNTTGQLSFTEMVAGSGRLVESYVYNGFGEVSEHRATWNAQGRLFAEYTRDALGRITRTREAVSGVGNSMIGKTFDYGYDSKGQLTSVTEDNVVTQQYAYDPNGNRLSLITPTGTVNGVYDAQDRLLSYGTKAYSYDALGSLSAVTDSATGQTTRYAYDAFKNLTRVELPDGRVIEYLIDGQNRRVGKKVNGVLVEGLVYNGQLRPVARLDGAGSVAERFVYSTGINVPAYMVKGGVNYRLVTDHLGSVRLVINVQTGEVAQRLDYDAFGRVTQDTNPGFQPFGFAGGLYDIDTKLVRFGARDYDAESGRWTANDPIKHTGGGGNLYAYSFNQPTNLADSTGTEPKQIPFGTIIGHFNGEGGGISVSGHSTVRSTLLHSDPIYRNYPLNRVTPSVPLSQRASELRYQAAMFGSIELEMCNLGFNTPELQNVADEYGVPVYAPLAYDFENFFHGYGQLPGIDPRLPINVVTPRNFSGQPSLPYRHPSTLD